ncbi:MAG: DUF4405 domain-containing protein [Desulfobacteraceae bacterium]|nr:DUF4405 domain-containing protein [Desulfobacteraceae bacterium]
MNQQIKIKKIVSLTALLSFLVVVLNSIALYIAPQGRVAHWVDWRFLGLTKTQWSDQHILVGLLFLIALCFHIYYNWHPIVAYLKNKARKIKVFTPNFNIALALTVVFTIGAYAEVAPFRWVVDFSEAIKNSVAESQGEPPYGHAQDSDLDTFAGKTGLDLADSLWRLKQAGIRVDNPKQTLLEIARQNKITPQDVYEAMQPDEMPEPDASLPENPPQGLGKQTLSNFCRQFGLDTAGVITALKNREITATPDASIRQIADQHGMEPADVYEIIKSE